MVVSALGVSPTAPAVAHSWYPMECCSYQDCGPVEEMTWVQPAGAGAPQLMVTTEHGRAVIPPNFPVRDSKDNRLHACMRYNPLGDTEIICVFVPPSM